MPDSPETLAQIAHRIDALEDRVSMLEHGPDAHTTRETPTPQVASNADAALPEWPTRSGSVFPVLGVALLGMAGAYLLRAVAESGSVPNLAAVALASAYAGGWLFAAAKLHRADGFSRTIYACVAALTLAPMLWESTLKFHYLSAGAAAGTLLAFTVVSYLLAWSARLGSIIWIASLTTAATAIVLAGVTRELLAFTAVLLVMALLNEIAAGTGRWSTTRTVSAFAADVLVCALIFIYSRPVADRLDYKDLSQGVLLAMALLLFLIYGVSGISRAVMLRHSITFPQIAQLLVSAALALTAVLRFATPLQKAAIAVACIAVSLASYAALLKHSRRTMIATI